MELTYDEAVRLLWIAVSERGYDFVYPNEWRDASNTCQYVNEAEQCPACIIGYLLHLFGISVEALSEVEGISVCEALGKLGIITDERTRILLIHVQVSQDDGCSWGESVEYAIDYASTTRL